MSLEELREKYLQRNEELNRIVSVESGYIILRVASEYKIALNRCSTFPDILSWVFHLAEKSWMTTEILHHFILVACREHKLEMPNP